MSELLPSPVLLDPPPGDPRALEELTGRLDRVADLLAGLGEQLGADAGAAPSWAGLDAAAARARVDRVADLARPATEALGRASGRLARHGDLLEDARARLARLHAAQEEDYGAAAARLGGIVDPADAGTAGVIEELRSAESARRRVATAIREEVVEDAEATAAVLAECSAVVGGSGGAGEQVRVLRHLEEVLPGWREHRLAVRGQEFATAFLGGDAFEQEQAARELLPWAGDGAVAAAVLSGLGEGGFREALRRLGDGSLSAASALARAMAAVLGAPVPAADARHAARVRGGRHVHPRDARTLDSDLVALGMGVVLAAGRGSPSAGPPPDTVREWGRQIVARERALGSERIVDRVRLASGPAQPGDPLQEVLVRLAETDDPAPAAALLRGQPMWTQLLARPWDDDGAAFRDLVGRAVQDPGDVAVRSGLRALAVGLGDDGDPAGWTVDRATAAGIAPVLAAAVADRPDVVTGPLARAAAGGGTDRTLLRGVGYLSSEQEAAGTLDAAVAPAAVPPAVGAGWTAVREYGQRLAHALDEFAAQERAEQQKHAGDLLMAVGGRVVGPLAALGAVHWDLDGTWDAGPDPRPHLASAPGADAVAPAASRAHAQVTELLGTPEPPVSPATGLLALATELVPGGPAGAGRRRYVRDIRDVLDLAVDGVQDLLDDEAVQEHRNGTDGD